MGWKHTEEFPEEPQLGRKISQNTIRDSNVRISQSWYFVDF